MGHVTPHSYHCINGPRSPFRRLFETAIAFKGESSQPVTDPRQSGKGPVNAAGSIRVGRSKLLGSSVRWHRADKHRPLWLSKRVSRLGNAAKERNGSGPTKLLERKSMILMLAVQGCSEGMAGVGQAPVPSNSVNDQNIRTLSKALSRQQYSTYRSDDSLSASEF